MQKLVVKILVLVKQTKIKGEKMGLTDIQKRLIQAIPQNDMISTKKLALKIQQIKTNHFVVNINLY